MSVLNITHDGCDKFKESMRQITKKNSKNKLEFKVGDLVLLKNHNKSHPWEEMCIPEVHLCKIINDHAFDLWDAIGQINHTSIANIYLLLQAEYIGSLLHDD